MRIRRQRPFRKPFQDHTRRFHVLTRRQFRIAIRERARPIMEQIADIVMDHRIAPTIPRYVPGSTTEVRGLVVLDVEAIALRPIFNPLEDTHRVAIAAVIGATHIVDRIVFPAMKFHNWDHCAGWLTRWQLVSGRVQVEGARYGSESSNPLGRSCITGEEASKAAAVRFSGSVDARRVDAIVVEKFV